MAAADGIFHELSLKNQVVCKNELIAIPWYTHITVRALGLRRLLL